MKPAPAFGCAICDRQIGKPRTHYVLKDDRVICSRCIDSRDLYDDLKCSGTRAGIAHVVGLWP